MERAHLCPSYIDEKTVNPKPTTEAEFTALSTTVREVIALTRLLGKSGLPFLRLPLLRPDVFCRKRQRGSSRRQR
jgi:hypothetical protein